MKEYIMKFLKKGAMFGLDARVALAVFGSLSVISGAALYSAIETAKVTTLHTEIENLEKGVSQFIYDTRKNIPTASSSNKFDLTYLANNNDSDDNWNGPYFKANRYGLDSVSSTLYSYNGYRYIPTDCISATSATNRYALLIRKNTGSSADFLSSDFAKAFHDTFDDDSDYANGKWRVLEKSGDSSKACIVKVLSEVYNNL
jgi:hypothetical protein